MDRRLGSIDEKYLQVSSNVMAISAYPSAHSAFKSSSNEDIHLRKQNRLRVRVAYALCDLGSLPPYVLVSTPKLIARSKYV